MTYLYRINDTKTKKQIIGSASNISKKLGIHVSTIREHTIDKKKMRQEDEINYYIFERRIITNEERAKISKYGYNSISF